MPPTARSRRTGGEVVRETLTSTLAGTNYCFCAQSPSGPIPRPLCSGAELHRSFGAVNEVGKQHPLTLRPQSLWTGAVPQWPFGSRPQPLSAQIELNFESSLSSQSTAPQGSARAAPGAATATKSTETATARKERDMPGSRSEAAPPPAAAVGTGRPSSKYGAPAGGNIPLFGYTA